MGDEIICKVPKFWDDGRVDRFEETPIGVDGMAMGFNGGQQSAKSSIGTEPLFRFIVQSGTESHHSQLARTLGIGSNNYKIMSQSEPHPSFRTREKQIFILALGTISFICFGSIFFLPEKAGQVYPFILVLKSISNNMKNISMKI